MRVPWMPREKAAIIKLRRDHQYSLNQLEAFTGRSRSAIQRILKRATRNFDLRNLPCCVRKQGALIRRVSMEFWMRQWQAFILGSEERPP